MLQTENVLNENNVEALRARHGVKLVKAEDEGTAVYRLPNGTYGFTYAPQSSEAPLFLKQAKSSYEIHKTADGAVLVVGYMTPADAQRMRQSSSIVEVHLLSSAAGEAVELVAVPQTRVLKFDEHSARAGQGFGLRLRPAKE